MKFQNQRLFSAQNFHGKLSAATMLMRAHALLINFCPYSPAVIHKYGGIQCPFEKLNGFRYRQNWLENFLVAASLNGYRDYNTL